MKLKKIFVLIVLFTTTTLALTSCGDNDDYSLGKFWVEFGTIEKTNDHDYKIVLDKGPVLFPSASNVPVQQLKNDMRVYVDFTILQDAAPGSSIDHYVKVNGIQEILSKPIVSYTPAISDSLGMDTIELPEYWIANNFITFHFFYAREYKQHMVNLTKHEALTSDGRVLLEFRHNAFNDPGKYSTDGFVSFPLKETFSEVQDSVQLRVQYKGFDKDKTIDITYYPRK